MPIGSNKFYFKNISIGGESSASPVEPVEANVVNIILTGNTDTNNNISVDYDTVSFNIHSNRNNIKIGYKIAGNVTSSDFEDGTLTGNIQLDENGNAIISKSISKITGSGHKDFFIQITNPYDINQVFATSNNVYIYEILPITASGGDEIETVDYIRSDAANSHIIVSQRIHKFTEPGINNFVLDNYGNYTGNANLWNTYFNTSSDDSYWKEDRIGFCFRSLIVGAGGYYIGPRTSSDPNANLGGAGAGELGVLHYPFNNVATANYTIQVGQNNVDIQSYGDFFTANTASIIFKGNAALERIAIQGGRSNILTIGGSGGGGSGNFGSELYLEQPFTNEDGEYYATGLAYRANFSASTPVPVSYPAFPDNFREFVYTASGCHGGYGSSIRGYSGGGGAFGSTKGLPDNIDPSEFVNAYGHNVTVNETNFRRGGHGISWTNNRGYPAANLLLGSVANVDFDQDEYPFRWFENPVYNGTNTTFDCAGGGTRPNFGSFPPPNELAIGALGPGGGGGWNNYDGSPGIVTISYPYANTRILSTEIIS